MKKQASSAKKERHRLQCLHPGYNKRKFLSTWSQGPDVRKKLKYCCSKSLCSLQIHVYFKDQQDTDTIDTLQLSSVVDQQPRLALACLFLMGWWFFRPPRGQIFGNRLQTPHGVISLYERTSNGEGEENTPRLRPSCAHLTEFFAVSNTYRNVVLGSQFDNVYWTCKILLGAKYIRRGMSSNSDHVIKQKPQER